MGFRFRRSVKLLPGIRVNVGLRGASLSVGGRGLTTNLSKRGVRSTVGIPGTGLSYSTSMSSGRRSSGRVPSRRQIEAAHRRALIEARRDDALAEVEAEEADLQDLLDSWRLVPDLPARSEYEAATRPVAFEFDGPRVEPLDEARSLEQFRAEARARAAEAHRLPWVAVAFATLVAAGVTGFATLAAPFLGLGAALDLTVWGAFVIPGVAVPAAAAIVAIGRWRARRALAAIRMIDDEWDDRWRAEQAAHLLEVHAWEARRDAARDAHEVADADRARWARRLLDGDMVALEESVADSLADLDFPFEALCRVELPDASSAYVLLDLPEVEDVLPETRTKVLKDGTKRDVKRTKADRVSAYAGLACGLAFLVARVAFVAAPTLGSVTVAAYTQRRQRQSGEVDDDFVYEVTITREWSAALDHDEMDSLAELQQLPSRIKPAASGDLGKIPAPSWMEV